MVADLGWADARRVGHQWVGEEHVLLALSLVDGVAGDVLRSAGATPDRIEETILTGLERADPPVEPRETDSPALTPSAYRTLGRAEGLALARGSEAAAEPLVAEVLAGSSCARVASRPEP